MEDILSRALSAHCQGQPFAFATVIETTLKGTPRKAGAKMVVFQDGSSWGTIGGGRNEKAAIAECLTSIKEKKPRTCTYNYFGREGESVCGGQMKVFIEPVLALPRLTICGGGHIGLPLSWLAKVIGFHVSVIDCRKSFASKKRFPHVDRLIAGDYKNVLANNPIGADGFIVIVTHGNEHDYECLRAVAQQPAAYIGVISSQPKRIKFFKRLKEDGVTEPQIKRIHIPMGFDIGSQTPAEIAVSITAELIAVKNNALIGTAKFKEKLTTFRKG